MLKNAEKFHILLLLKLKPILILNLQIFVAMGLGNYPLNKISLIQIYRSIKWIQYILRSDNEVVSCSQLCASPLYYRESWIIFAAHSNLPLSFLKIQT